MSSDELWVLALNAAILGVPFALSWTWGSAPERVIASAFVGAMVADVAYHAVLNPWTVYETVDLGHLAIGLVMMGILGFVALRANRFYPLWIASLQILVVLSHFAREVSAGVAELAYAVLTYAPYVFQIVILTAGIFAHRRRVRRSGIYPSWRGSSEPSEATGPMPGS